jgi:AraC-like DNA-binding protein
MAFDFNQYSTPLLFGFAQGWLYAVLFWVRGWRQGRLSDLIFGWLLVAMAFDIWEYMLGFAGIEILWRALNFFPRTLGFLLPALAYFYLKSQFNADFRFRRRDVWHAAPFLLHATYHVAVFLQGPDFVKNWEENVHNRFGINHLEWVASVVLQVVYFWWAYRLYREYCRWAPTQFSDPEALSFAWFRNFLLAFLASGLFSWGMTVLDLWLDLDFWHDWWDELFNAALLYYLAIEGYAQMQPRKMHFEDAAPATAQARAEKLPEPELALWKSKIERLMAEEKIYLEPDLALSDLAQRLHTNASVLSAAINGAFGKNFNDFVNEYRVEAVKRLLQDPSVRHLSLLGIGLECGFNSKSTFNRAFKKATGSAPGAFLEQEI